MRSLSVSPRRHGRAMHRALKKHREKIAFDNWLDGVVKGIHTQEFMEFASNAALASQLIKTFATAMEEFRKGVTEAFRKAHDALLASGHKPTYLAVTLLPERHHDRREGQEGTPRPPGQSGQGRLGGGSPPESGAQGFQGAGRWLH